MRPPMGSPEGWTGTFYVALFVQCASGVVQNFWSGGIGKLEETYPGCGTGGLVANKEGEGAPLLARFFTLLGLGKFFTTIFVLRKNHQARKENIVFDIHCKQCIDNLVTIETGFEGVPMTFLQACE